MRGFTAIGAVVLAGCYQPSIGDCSFKCAAAPDACPEGLMGDGEFCRTPGNDGPCGAPPSGWTFTPLNFDTNDSYIVAGGQDWLVSATNQYDTDGPPPGTTPPVKDDARVRLIRIGTLSIPSGVTLAFTGIRTVILVADSANIDGTTIARTGSFAANEGPCIATDAMGTTSDSAGGAGDGGLIGWASAF